MSKEEQTSEEVKQETYHPFRKIFAIVEISVWSDFMRITGKTAGSTLAKLVKEFVDKEKSKHEDKHRGSRRSGSHRYLHSVEVSKGSKGKSETGSRNEDKSNKSSK